MYILYNFLLVCLYTDVIQWWRCLSVMRFLNECIHCKGETVSLECCLKPTGWIYSCVVCVFWIRWIHYAHTIFFVGEKSMQWVQLELDLGLPVQKFRRVKKQRCRPYINRWVRGYQLEFDFNPPKNDKQRYRQLEERYCRERNNKVIERQMWEMLVDYAMKAIQKERQKKGFWISYEDMQIKAYNAASSSFIQYVTRPDFRMKDPLNYVYKWVQTELYYKTKVDDLFKNINGMKKRKVKQYFDTLGVEY